MIKHLGREPTHPGEVLREDVLPSLGLSVTKASELLGISRTMLNKVLSGDSRMTPSMALRVGRLVGNGPEVWMRMQSRLDLWTARKEIGNELKKIPKPDKMAVCA